jgi:hypothetical protein
MTDPYRGVLGTPNQKWDDDKAGGNPADDLLKRLQQAAAAECVPYQDGMLFKAQHDALQSMAQQYGVTAFDLEQNKYHIFKRIDIAEGYVQKMDMTNCQITTPDKTLVLPSEFTRLERLMVGLNNLQALILPATLIQLQELSCHSNYLTELHIPDTLVQLRDIRCSDNRLTSLRIPDTLKQLEQVVCQHMILDESSRVALEALQKKGVNVVL